MSKVVPDFKNSNGLWVRTYYKEGLQYITKSAQKHNNMMQRCKKDGSYQINAETYIGSSVSENFKNFQFFAEWYNNQIGSQFDYELDKDLLVNGNLVYSEDVCVLVPKELNLFLVNREKLRGPYPQGVSASYDKFMVLVGAGVNREYVGTFNDVHSAASAYKIAKERAARRWYERLSKGEFVVDPRVIERMRTWEFEETNKRQLLKIID